MSLLPVGFGASGDDYTIDDSLRFRSSASAELTRTFGTPTDNNKWTYSVWVKRGVLSSGYNTLFGRYLSGTNFIRADFLSDKFRVYQYVGGIQILVETTAVFRDPSAWYHLTLVMDTSNATSTDRVIFYVNGVRVTAFSSTTYPSLNLATTWNVSGGVTHEIGGLIAGDFDGYMTEINFVDGQALTADDFGEFDDNGTWKPLAYTGTYGTNGFYLDGVGVTDESGNGNNWTNNNLNLSTSTATTYDQMKDTPSLVDTNAGNFATLNPIASTVVNSISEANLKVSGSSNSIHGTIAVTSGKYYFEFTKNSNGDNQLGIAYGWGQAGTQSFRRTWRDGNGSPSWLTDGGTAGSGAAQSLSAGDILGVALDMDNNAIYFAKNNTWMNSGDPTSGASKTGAIWTDLSNQAWQIFAGSNANGCYVSLNCGQRPFAYTPPSGFLKLNTFNLPDSTIEKGSDYFNTVLYTGTGDNLDRSIAAVGFQPDFVWQKRRSGASTHALYDSVRGSGSGKALASNLTNSEGTIGDVLYGYISSFDSDGFSTTKGTINNDIFNVSGQTFVAWNWLASNTTASNTVGSIPSTVSVNTTSGFSIVSYTGNGTSGATVGHGLGVAPSMIIVKNRDAANYWIVQHTSLPSYTYNLYLQATDPQQNDSQFTAANTSTVFQLDAGKSVNITSNKFIAYCFAEVPGYSAIGSYTGNGSADGPFVYTGFRPRYLMIKRTDVADAWAIKDTARDTYNVDDSVLKANESTAESTSIYWNIDILSNGFKLRNLGSTFNNNGGTYIYIAFAENPFKNANAR